MVWDGVRIVVRAGLRLLVYRFPGGSAGHGGQFDVGRPEDTLDSCPPQNVFPVAGGRAGDGGDGVSIAFRPERILPPRQAGRVAELRFGYAFNVGPLPSFRRSGFGAHRLDRIFHVGYGWERNRL